MNSLFITTCLMASNITNNGFDALLVSQMSGISYEESQRHLLSLVDKGLLVKHNDLYRVTQLTASIVNFGRAYSALEYLETP